MKRRQGFTLLELLVVLAVIAIFVLVGWTPFWQWYNKPDPYSQYSLIFQLPDNGPTVTIPSDLIIRKDLPNPDRLYFYERQPTGLVKVFELKYKETLTEATFEKEIMKKK